MSNLLLYLLDESDNIKREIKLQKPKTYEDLLKQINTKKFFPKKFELFLPKENNEKAKISNEVQYKKIDNILFIKEATKTLFDIDYNKLSESKIEILENISNCILCQEIIENENPYLCYKCQKIYHEKCLKNWDKKCKTLKRVFICPYCRNELPIEKWNKKVCYNENLKEATILLDKNQKLNNDNAKQKQILKNYENIIKKYVDLSKILLFKLAQIHSLMKLEKSSKLDELISKFSLKNLDLVKLSKVIDEELDKIKNYISKNKFHINENIIQNNQIINNQNIIINNEQLYQKKQVLIPNNLNNLKKININNDEDILVNNIVDNEKQFINKKNKIKNNLNEKEDKIDEIKILKDNNKKRINLLYFSKSNETCNIFGKKFVENNENNIELIINGNQNKLTDKFELKNGENLITIIINENLINLAHMFSGCKTLQDISELKNLDVKDVKDLSHMFYGCSLLSDITSLQNWNVSNVNNFSYMFNCCSSLSNIKSLEKWDVSNGVDFSYMFQGCTTLTDIQPLQYWNVSKANNFNRMFCRCSSLLDLNPLKNWNTNNCNNFSYMFQGCSSLLDIKGLENWNVSNSNNFKGMFYKCSAISDIKPLENWNISNCKEFQDMFSECASLSDITILKKWNISLENIKLLKMK